MKVKEKGDKIFFWRVKFFEEVPIFFGSWSQISSKIGSLSVLLDLSLIFSGLEGFFSFSDFVPFAQEVLTLRHRAERMAVLPRVDWRMGDWMPMSSSWGVRMLSKPGFLPYDLWSKSAHMQRFCSKDVTFGSANFVISICGGFCWWALGRPGRTGLSKKWRPR